MTSFDYIITVLLLHRPPFESSMSEVNIVAVRELRATKEMELCEDRILLCSIGVGGLNEGGWGGG